MIRAIFAYKLFEKMLGRRILRIKVFKTIYSLSENQSLTFKEASQQFDKSCEATRDLYLFLLALPAAVTAEASARIEAARNKFNPTAEERNPNMRFVNNGVARILAEDPDFNKIISKKKLSWDQCDVLIRHLYENLRSRDYFAEYMNAPSAGIAEDAKLWVRFFEEELVDNRELEDIMEDMCIWWNDDLGYALTWDCRTVEALGRGGRWSMPELYLSEQCKDQGMDDDREFAAGLLREAHAGFEKYCSDVAACTLKWDRSRICATDLALIVCGLAEAKAFPGTPRKVIINEYVELSKFYSTPESRGFVNGILDKLINRL